MLPQEVVPHFHHSHLLVPLSWNYAKSSPSQWLEKHKEEKKQQAKHLFAPLFLFNLYKQLEEP